jgi:hypothetical protein
MNKISLLLQPTHSISFWTFFSYSIWLTQQALFISLRLKCLIYFGNSIKNLTKYLFKRASFSLKQGQLIRKVRNWFKFTDFLPFEGFLGAGS